MSIYHECSKAYEESNIVKPYVNLEVYNCMQPITAREGKGWT